MTKPAADSSAPDAPETAGSARESPPYRPFPPAGSSPLNITGTSPPPPPYQLSEEQPMYCRNCGIQGGDTDKFCRECGHQTPVGQQNKSASDAPQRLYRVMWDKKIAGVCSGFAQYLDVDVTLV